MKGKVIPLPVFKRMGFYLDVLKLVAQRSTCRPDRKAGAILIDKQYRIVSMGYNGTPPGIDHCCDTGCIKYEGHCIGTLHAEMNALANLKRNEEGLIMLCTLQPCLYCLKMLIAFKIKHVIYLKSYADEARDTWITELKPKVISTEPSAIGSLKMEMKERFIFPDGNEIFRLVTHNTPLFGEVE